MSLRAEGRRARRCAMVASRPQPRWTQPPASGRWRRRSLLCGAACLLGWQLAQRSDGEVFVGSSQAAEVRNASPSCVCRGAAKEGASEDPFERLQNALGKGKASEPVSKAKAPGSPVKKEEQGGQEEEEAQDPFARMEKALNKGKAKTPEPSKAKAPAAAAECEDCDPEYDEQDLEVARQAKKEEEAMAAMAEDPFDRVSKVLPSLPKPGKTLSPEQLESAAMELDGSVNLQEVRLRPIDTRATWTMGPPIPAGSTWEGTGALVVAIRRPG